MKFYFIIRNLKIAEGIPNISYLACGSLILDAINNFTVYFFMNLAVLKWFYGKKCQKIAF